MKQIVINPSMFSELDLCPRQFYLKYQQFAKYPKVIGDEANEVELIDHCIPEILSGKTNIPVLVANKLEEIDKIFTPQSVKNVVKLLSKFNKERALQGDLLNYNKKFMQEYVLAQDRVQIKGLIHQVEKLSDGSIKATIFKGEERFYTNLDLVTSYLPLIYALAIKKLYDCNNIVISYFMVKHNVEEKIEFKNQDWDFNHKVVSAHLQKLMEVREQKTVVGSHCAYCPRKSICNDYKQTIIDSFEIKNVHELMSIGMGELVKYIGKLEIQKAILIDKSNEMKNIMIHELLNNGNKQAKFGEHEVIINQKNTIDCDTKAILNKVKPTDHEKIVKIDNKKLEHYLKGLTKEQIIEIMMHCEVRYYKPSLVIKKVDQKSKDLKLFELMKI